MTTVQILLLLCLLFIIVYIYLRLKSSVMDAIVFIFLGLMGAVLVIFPDLTTRIAHAIGIGRGADMIFYFSILFFGFISLKLYSRIRKLEQRFTEIVRDESIREAQEKEKEGRS